MEIILVFLAVVILILLLWMLFVRRQAIFRRVSIWRANGHTLEEDLLKQIYLTEQNAQYESVAELVQSLNEPDQLVWEAIDRLLEDGLVEGHDDHLKLTDTGRQNALKILRAHRLWERFLADNTGFPEAEWHAQADRLEHRLTGSEIEGLAARLGNPAYDPHGDPIPTAAGELPHSVGQPIAEFEEGTACRIVHLEDEPEIIYQRLRELNLSLGSEFYLLESSEGRLVIWLEGEEIALRSTESANVFVTPIDDWDFRDRLPGERLSSLQPGELGTVNRISPVIRGQERRRLMDLGIVPGTTIRTEFKSPNGEPVAYEVRGALIALRIEQTDHIRIHRSAA